jgi:flavodoxin
MKIAVVYYSLDGHCAFVAEKLKALLNADLIQLHTQDEKKRGKMGKFLWGGGMVFRRIKPPLKPSTFNSSAYDVIIVGAPVWAGTPAPPIQTFLSGAGIAGKKIALFVCHGGGKGKALEKLKMMFTGNDIIAEADFITPAANSGEEMNRQIEEWAKKLG